MSTYKRHLEEQLAQVASGQRSSVDGATKANVASEEYREREQRRSHEAALERASADQIAATAQAQRNAERSAEQLLAATREATWAAEEQHRQNLELEEQRLDFERASHDEAMQSAEEAREAARIAHSKIVEEIRDAAESAASLASSREEKRRIAENPTYAGALRLHEMLELENSVNHLRQAAESLAPVFEIWDSLVARVAAEDAKWTHLDDETVHETQRILAEAQAKRNALIEEERRSIAEIRAQIREGELRLSQCQVSWNPMTWTTSAENRRIDLEEHLLDLDEDIIEHENRIRAITQQKVSTARPSKAGKARYARVLDACREADIAQFVDRLRPWIDGAGVANTSGAPSPTGNQTGDQESPWYTDEEDDDDAPDVDYGLCVTLEHVRKIDNTATISYPGLGAIPYGKSLSEVMQRIVHLKSEVRRYKAMGEQNGRTLSEAGERLFFLTAAARTGFLPGGRVERLLDGERSIAAWPRDLLQLASYVLIYRDLELSSIAEHMGVSLHEAEDLRYRLSLSYLIDESFSTGEWKINVEETV